MTSKESYGMWAGFAAVIVAVFMMAWVIRGDIAANTAAIAKLEGVLIAHTSSHVHGTKVAVAESAADGE